MVIKLKTLQGELAIPGGMIDKDESPLDAVVREFTEEALGGKKSETDRMNAFWQRPNQLYTGYVDDPRNTDNAWIETICMNFHDGEDIFERDKIRLEVLHTFFLILK